MRAMRFIGRVDDRHAFEAYGPMENCKLVISFPMERSQSALAMGSYREQRRLFV